jgi:dodecin
MSDHVYKTVEVTGSSPDVISDAIRVAVAKAAQTLRNLEWFEVVTIRGMIEDGKVAYFQGTLKLGFRLE